MAKDPAGTALTSNVPSVAEPALVVSVAVSGVLVLMLAAVPATNHAFKHC